MTKLILLASLLILFARCAGWKPESFMSASRSKVIYNHKVKGEQIIIKKISNRNSRSSDLIAEIFNYGKITYQLYYGASFFKTRKEIFTYCSQGAQIGLLAYEGTEEPGIRYPSKLSNDDKFILHKIDSLISSQPVERYSMPIKKVIINGFREVKGPRESVDSK